MDEDYDEISNIMHQMKINRSVHNFKLIPIKHKYIPNNFYGMNVIMLLKEYDECQNEDIFLSILNFYFHIKTEELSNFVDNMKLPKQLSECFKAYIQRKISQRMSDLTVNGFLDFLELNHYDIILTLKEHLINLREHYIYILELEHGKYYVGLTNNIQRRMKEHITNNGSKFTKEYKMIRKIGHISCIELIEKMNLKANRLVTINDCEEIVTLSMIDEYEIENVEGAQYTGKRSRNTVWKKILNVNHEDIRQIFFKKNSI